MIPVKPVKKSQNRVTNISTDLQKLAQKENFALFQLAAMKSNLYHVRNQVTNILDASALHQLEKCIIDTVDLIKRKQDVRKQNRKFK